MTENKPIMIDGVDVSGCEDYGYRGSAGYWCHNYDEPCTDYPNCYFKQLARKTQECEHWKHQAELGSDTTDRLAKQLEEKEQECEELREYHNKCCQDFEKEKQDLINKYNQLSRDFYNGKYCNVDKCKQLDKLKASKEQAEQKLERISEFVKTFDEEDETRIIILQIIDEME